MSAFHPGDDVVVAFEGIEHAAEVIGTSVHSGYVMCRIAVDPLGDYGSISARLSPQSIVCVQPGAVRHG